MLKKNASFFLIIILALLLVVLVMWVFEKRIKQIEKKNNLPPSVSIITNHKLLQNETVINHRLQKIIYLPACFFLLPLY